MGPFESSFLKIPHFQKTCSNRAQVPTFLLHSISNMSIITTTMYEFKRYYSNIWIARLDRGSIRKVTTEISQTLINSAPYLRKELYPMYEQYLKILCACPVFPLELILKLKRAFMSPDRHASRIQRAFKKSRGYAEWAWHPGRLKAQGFFEV
ncbi:MAG: hypothetical protein EBV73_07285 [Rhodocyclales bacterium]|nr:hypothetical protein [Rhodocyclales bacterium]